VGTISLNYIGMAIVVLEWENLIIFYSDLYFSITILLFVFLGLSFIIKTPKPQKDTNKTTPKEATSVETKKDL
jgi:hypothetical protein